MATHLEENLERDSERIRRKIVEMSALVQKAFKDCVLAIEQHDRELAYKIIGRDQAIDQFEKEIDQLCLEFIVRQQPAGATLRFAYAAIKINAEVERIGDYAESIARQILKLSDQSLDAVRGRLQEIAALGMPMLQDSIQAFLTQDPELARKTMLKEALVDDLRDMINAELIQLHKQNVIPLEALNPLMTIARRFERMTDQAKNICEEALYMCTGEYQKHKAPPSANPEGDSPLKSL